MYRAITDKYSSPGGKKRHENEFSSFITIINLFQVAGLRLRVFSASTGMADKGQHGKGLLSEIA